MGGVEIRHRFSSAVHVFYRVRHHGASYMPFTGGGSNGYTAHTATLEQHAAARHRGVENLECSRDESVFIGDEHLCVFLRTSGVESHVKIINIRIGLPGIESG